MTNQENIRFTDNRAAQNPKAGYITVTVDVMLVLASWRESLFSFEWLLPNGAIRNLDALPEHEKPKREAIEEKLASGEPIEKPILGIGINDNIEIGSGRAEFLTLAAHGIREIPVHIARAGKNDFRNFIVSDEAS